MAKVHFLDVASGRISHIDLEFFCLSTHGFTQGNFASLILGFVHAKILCGIYGSFFAGHHGGILIFVHGLMVRVPKLTHVFGIAKFGQEFLHTHLDSGIFQFTFERTFTHKTAIAHHLHDHT